MYKKFLLAVLSMTLLNLQSQIMTKEDSLSAGLDVNNHNVVISGYGEMKYQYDFHNKKGQTNITRNVIFLGYNFNEKISMFSELEIEDTKVGGSNIGTFNIEQLVLKFNIDRNNYLLAGLYVPRIGFYNENHLPNTFMANDRAVVEKLVLPSTWREIGVCYYGASPNIKGLHYTLGISNGLNSQKFSNSSGIRSGRGGGYTDNSTLSVNSSLLYNIKKFRFQASSTFTGTANNVSVVGDTSNYGFFGMPISINEINGMYKNKAITAKALGAVIFNLDANTINNKFNKKMSNIMYGFYGELAYDLLYNKYKGQKSLNIFARYEKLNLHSSNPDALKVDNSLQQDHLFAGFSYQPIRNIAIKLDYHFAGNRSTSDNINYSNLGLAYSF